MSTWFDNGRIINAREVAVKDHLEASPLIHLEALPHHISLKQQPQEYEKKAHSKNAEKIFLDKVHAHAIQGEL